MSDWGELIFDDDDAANFAYQLDDLGEEARLRFLESTLEVIATKEPKFDGVDGVRAVAAASLVARELEGGAIFRSVICGPSNPVPPPTDETVEVARKAVLVLLDESSDADWWFGYELDGRSFRSMLNHLLEVLSGRGSGNSPTLW